jgi:hypothetical protein
VDEKSKTSIWMNIHSFYLPETRSAAYKIVIKSRRLRWTGHVARVGERTGAYRALMGKPEGRRPLGRPRRRWDNNIKMDLREVEWWGGGIDWIDLAQDRNR